MAFYANLASTLAGLTVAGITTTYAAPPAIESVTNFPAMFPRLPSGENRPETLTSAAGLKMATCDLVVLVARESLNTRANNFDAAIDLIDALDAALELEFQNGTIDGWSISPEVNEDGWMLVATVEASQ